MISIPVVVTLHDATMFSDPDMYGDERGRLLPIRHQVLRSSTRRASSCRPGRPATSWSGCSAADPAKVNVAYHGIDTTVFHQPAGRGGARPGRPAPGPGTGETYVGSLGEMSRRKNIPELIRGWDAGRRRVRAPARHGAGRPRRPGTRRIAEAVAEVPSAAPKLIRPGVSCGWPTLPGFMGGATVMAFTESVRGLRLPDAGGDGLRGGRAHRPAAVTARRSAARWPPTPSRSGSPSAATWHELLRRRRSAASAVRRPRTPRSQLFTWTAPGADPPGHLRAGRERGREPAADGGSGRWPKRRSCSSADRAAGLRPLTVNTPEADVALRRVCHCWPINWCGCARRASGTSSWRPRIGLRCSPITSATARSAWA